VRLGPLRKSRAVAVWHELGRGERAKMLSFPAMRLAVRGVAGVFALYFVACSGTDVGLPREQYVLAFASAMCSAAATCCAAAGLAHDPSICNSAQTQEFEIYLQEYGHNYSYDAQAAEACLKRLQASLAACVVPRGGLILRRGASGQCTVGCRLRRKRGMRE
jgi:hypothetical protein